MKYLRRYNEAKEFGHIHSKICKGLTGYTSSELSDIFELNLEDNTEFEVLDINICVVKEYLDPTSIDQDLSYVKIINIELTETFQNDLLQKNLEVFKSQNSHKMNSVQSYLLMVNNKILNVIGRKYDLLIDKITLKRMLDNDKYIVTFNVNKDTT